MNAGLAAKDDAYQFLKELRASMNTVLPAPDQMRKEIRDTVAAAKDDKTRVHLNSPEAAFVNGYLTPNIFGLLEKRLGKDQARQVFLSEYRNMRRFCSNTPARTERHPFGKTLSSPKDTMSRWKHSKRVPLVQSCPDLAIGEPFKIVFEAKYFEKGSDENASTQLVKDIYQTFFYRALPYVPATKNRPAWDYEFGCLIAYDASANGSLQRSWTDLAPNVKRGFWVGANVYVMILRGH